MKVVLLFFCFLGYGALRAQGNCSTFSIHEAYEMVKVHNVSKTEVLTYKKYPSFNFKDFKPAEKGGDDSSYVKVGYNQKNEIREIIGHHKNDSLTNYRMRVFNYEDRRILILNHLQHPSLELSYWPFAIIMDKRTNSNFMVSRVWLEEFTRITSFMILDENLLPTDLFLIKNGQVQVFSQLKCTNDQVTEEYVHLFSLQDHDLKIDFNTCPEILKRTCRYETPDLSFHVCPPPNKTKRYPIWIRLLLDRDR